MPHHQLQTEIERTLQKEKALHMLILSGVVRPSYAKLRYAIPLLNSEDPSSALQEKPVHAVRAPGLLRKFFELLSRTPRMRDRSDTIELGLLTRLSTSTRSSL